MELNTQKNSLAPSSRPRCRHISRNGRPCRYLAASAGKDFCKEHLPPAEPGSPEELTKALKKTAGRFDTPETVKDVLFLVFCALAEGRITERRAGILCYLAQTVLHSHRAIALKKQLDNKPRQRVFIDNLPGPEWETEFVRQQALRDMERAGGKR
jgi:hypothetical protein